MKHSQSVKCLNNTSTLFCSSPKPNSFLVSITVPDAWDGLISFFLTLLCSLLNETNVLPCNMPAMVRFPSLHYFVPCSACSTKPMSFLATCIGWFDFLPYTIYFVPHPNPTPSLPYPGWSDFLPYTFLFLIPNPIPSLYHFSCLGWSDFLPYTILFLTQSQWLITS